MRNLDRRQSPRTVVEKILTIQVEPDNHAIVLNFSDGGIGFHAFKGVAETGPIQFSFALPNHQRIQATGELVWRDVTKKTGGLRISSLPATTREQIRNWALQAVGPSSEVLPADPLAEPRYPAVVENPARLEPKRACLEPFRSLPEPAAAPFAGSQVSGPQVSGPQASGPQPEIARSPLVDDLRSQYQSDLLSSDLRALVNSRPKFLRGFVITAPWFQPWWLRFFFSVYGPQINSALTQLRATAEAKLAPASVRSPTVPPVPATPAAAPAGGTSSLAGSPGGLSSCECGSDAIGTSTLVHLVVPPPAAPEAPTADSRAPDHDSKQTAVPERSPARVPRVPDDPEKTQNRAPVASEDTGEKELAIAREYLRNRGASNEGGGCGISLVGRGEGKRCRRGDAGRLCMRAAKAFSRSCDQARVLLDAAAGKGSDEACDQALAEMARARCK